MNNKTNAMRLTAFLVVALLASVTLTASASAAVGDTAFRAGQCRGDSYHSTGSGGYEYTKCQGVYTNGSYVCVGTYVQRTVNGETTKNCEGFQSGGPPPSAA